MVPFNDITKRQAQLGVEIVAKYITHNILIFMYCVCSCVCLCTVHVCVLCVCA